MDAPLPPNLQTKAQKTLALVCTGSFTIFPHEGFKWGLFRGMVAQSKILQNAIKQMKNNVLSMQLDTKHHFSNIGTESKNIYKTQVFYNILSCFIAVKLCRWVLQLCPGWPQGWPHSVPRRKASAHTNSPVAFFFGMSGRCKTHCANNSRLRQYYILYIIYYIIYYMFWP